MNMGMVRPIGQTILIGYSNPMAEIVESLKQATRINYTNPMSDMVKDLKQTLNISYKNPMTDITEALKRSIKINYENPMTEMAKSLKQAMEINYTNPMNENIDAIYESFHSLEKLLDTVKSFDILFHDFSHDQTVISSISNSNFQEFDGRLNNDAKTHGKIVSDINVNAITLTELDSNELSCDIENIFTDRQNWQIRFMESLEKWKAKNPLIAFLLEKLTLIIVTAILTFAIESAGQVVAKKAAVRNEPSSQSIVNNYIYNDQTIVIIESHPYYYKIIHYDDESQAEVVQGWVAKRSIKPYGTRQFEQDE